jgi:hypothetical protein
VICFIARMFTALQAGRQLAFAGPHDLLDVCIPSIAALFLDDVT